MTRIVRSQAFYVWLGLLAATVAPASANVYGICELDSTFGAGGISSAQYATAVVTAGCNPGFSSSLVPGAAVSPGSLGPGLTTAGLSVLQPMPFGGNAVASSIASLNQGALRVFSDTQGVIGSCGGSCMTTGGTATAESLFDDTIHFAITNGASSATGTFLAHLDGGLSSQPNSSTAYGISEQFSLGGVGAGCWASSGGGSPAFQGPCLYGNYGFLTSSYTNLSATGFDFSGTFSIANGQSSLLWADLQANCSGGQLCDFANTASFSLSLPSNVSYTSDSGVLFTQPLTTTTPEPATYGLVGSMLLALGAIRRRSYSR